MSVLFLYLTFELRVESCSEKFNGRYLLSIEIRMDVKKTSTNSKIFL